MKSYRKETDGNFNYNNQLSGFILLKSLLTLSFFSVLILPLVSAVEVSMDSEFAQGETFLAKFSGNFVDQITSENVQFYRGYVAIPMTYEIVKIENDFYVYALLVEKTPGNYSVRVEGVRYYKTTQIIDDDIISNFRITNETAAFSLSPGALVVSDDFSVELQNLKDNAITVSINGPESITSESAISLNTGQKKIVSFTLNDALRGLTTIEFSSGNTNYSLPVYLDTNATEPEETKNFEMEFQPKTVSVSLATDSNTKRILYLKNTGEETLEDIFFNISLVLEPYMTISPEKINTLNPGEIEKIELKIISDLEEATIEGRVTAYSENASAFLTLVLDFIKDFVPTEEETDNEPIILTLCAQLNGTICPENLECSGETKRARDGVCCLAPAICEEQKKSSTGKIIGWGLLILALVIIFWFFRRKYRGIQRRRPF